MSWNFLTKEDVTIYLVSEAGDYYLVGQNEDEYLITQEAGGWNNLTKPASGSWTFLNK